MQRGKVELGGKRVFIFGLGRSGVGAANLLAMAGAEVTVTDKKSERELKEYIQRLSPSVNLSLGDYPHSMNGTDLVVVSPGVPLRIEPIVKAREKGIKIIGELELAYQIVTSNKLQVTSEYKNSSLVTYHSLPHFLAVTGTNGKSTTTTLLDLMLKKGGFKTLLGGNIGNALTEEILKLSTTRYTLHADFVVVEVSSFQLESISEFRPFGATILNITPDHLDRYHSLNEYIDAKCRIFENQTNDDFLILNADNPMTEEILKRVKGQGSGVKGVPQIFYFSRKNKVRGAYLKDGIICFDLPDVPISFNLHPSTFKIKGVHNLENAMASSAMALLAGCKVDAVAEALRDFPGLEHRLEFVKEIGGIRYINDSKGTNVGAVVKSIEGFTEPIILIAGGRDKAGDFTQLRPLIREKVKALVLIGEASDKMKGILGDLTRTVFASDMKEAVDKAREMADSGDIVLLSPACASFDMFRDFEDRGQQFKKIVTGLS